MPNSGLIQTLAALAGPIAAFIAVGVGAWQARLQRQQLRQNLFAKRFGVYLALRQFLNTLSELGKTLDAACLLQNTKQAEFLFEPEIEEFLKEVFRRANKLQSIKEQEARAAQQLQGRALMELSAQHDAESSWLISEAPKLARKKFEPYLRLKSY
jgi:hypothetical protein